MSWSEIGGGPRSRAGAAWAVAAATLLLASCGFHLQGRVPLPATLAVTHIDAEDAQSDFVQQLRRQLIASGARVAARREGATAVVSVERDALTERILSVSAENLPREYELTYSVRFRVGDGTRELIAPEELTATRDFSFDERTALAKEREKELLSDALARDLAGLVLRRLATLP
jgi:LPS-assembly lipoprotein